MVPGHCPAVILEMGASKVNVPRVSTMTTYLKRVLSVSCKYIYVLSLGMVV